MREVSSVAAEDSPSWLCSIDKEVGDILRDAKGKSKTQISQSLSVLHRKILLESRVDLFNISSDKLLKLQSDDAEPVQPGASEAKWYIDDWTLKDRRNMNYCCDDIIDLFEFATEKNDKFPREILVHKKSDIYTLLQKSAAKNQGDHLHNSDIDIGDFATLKERINTMMTDMNDQKEEMKKLKEQHSEEIDRIHRELSNEIAVLRGTIESLQENTSKAVHNYTSTSAQSQPSAVDTEEVVVIGITDGHASAASSDQNTNSTIGEVKAVNPSAPQALPPPTQSYSQAARQTPNHTPSNKDNSSLQHGPGSRTRIDSNGYATILSRKEAEEAKKHQTRHRVGDGAFELKGAPKISTQTLYLENVRIPEGSSNRDIAESVIVHARKHGVDIKSCWVHRNKYVSDRVGCKVSVPSDQVHKCKNLDIWPEHVICRDWELRTRRAPNSGGSFGSGSGRSSQFGRRWGDSSRRRNNYRNSNYGNDDYGSDNYGSPYGANDYGDYDDYDDYAYGSNGNR